MAAWIQGCCGWRLEKRIQVQDGYNKNKNVELFVLLNQFFKAYIAIARYLRADFWLSLYVLSGNR